MSPWVRVFLVSLVNRYFPPLKFSFSFFFFLFLPSILECFILELISRFFSVDFLVFVGWAFISEIFDGGCSFYASVECLIDWFSCFCPLGFYQFNFWWRLSLLWVCWMFDWLEACFCPLGFYQFNFWWRLFLLWVCWMFDWLIDFPVFVRWAFINAFVDGGCSFYGSVECLVSVKGRHLVNKNVKFYCFWSSQIASLDRQLKVVDTYLDRIEAKFRQTDDTSVPHWSRIDQPSSPEPRELSLIEVTFPSSEELLSASSRDDRMPSPPTHTTSPLPSSPAPSTPSPPAAAAAARQIHPAVPANPSGAKPHSVSITVLSRHKESDQVRVAFRQSFPSETTASSSSPLSPTPRPTRPVSRTSMGTAEQPPYPEVIAVSSPPPPPPLPQPATNKVSTATGNSEDPYSSENLTRRIAEKERRLKSGPLSRVSCPGDAEEESTPRTVPDYRHNTDFYYNRDYFVKSTKPTGASSSVKPTTATVPEILARTENTVRVLVNSENVPCSFVVFAVYTVFNQSIDQWIDPTQGSKPFNQPINPKLTIDFIDSTNQSINLSVPWHFKCTQSINQVLGIGVRIQPYKSFCPLFKLIRFLLKCILPLSFDFYNRNF